jgi:hypothetical protein
LNRAEFLDLLHVKPGEGPTSSGSAWHFADPISRTAVLEYGPTEILPRSARYRNTLRVSADWSPSQPRTPARKAELVDLRRRMRERDGLAVGGRWIRTIGPALHTHRFGPPSCRPRDSPVRQTEITRSRPGTKRSTPASAAEYTGPPPGALRSRVTDLHSSAYGHAAGEVVRARAITAMVLRSRLQNHVEGRVLAGPIVKL